MMIDARRGLRARGLLDYSELAVRWDRMALMISTSLGGALLGYALGQALSGEVASVIGAALGSFLGSRGGLRMVRRLGGLHHTRRAQ